MEPCPCYLQFFLHQLICLRILSWLSLWLGWVDTSKFGGVVHTHKHFTYTMGAEGEVPFLSPGLAKLLPPVTFSGLPLRPSLGWSLRGQGHGIKLRCATANGLAQPGWINLEKDAGCGPIGCAIPYLPSPYSSAHPILW